MKSTKRDGADSTRRARDRHARTQRGSVTAALAAAAATFAAGGAATGQYVSVYGGMTYDTSGLQHGYASASFESINSVVSEAGVAVGNAFKFDNGSLKSIRAVRWDAWGHATELANLGTDGSGVTTTKAW